MALSLNFSPATTFYECEFAQFAAVQNISYKTGFFHIVAMAFLWTLFFPPNTTRNVQP